ncbi:MAG: hypothetical protein JKX80_02895 [Candidatus Pacebacteria bacterium]|nr:hypothetical protein [Candidatus Paceibacterota bacterium]
MPNNNKQVQFNEPGMAYNRGPRRPRNSWLIKLVIKLGLAKDAKQASIVLIAIGVLALVLAFIFWPKGAGYEIVPQPGLQGLSYLHA